MWNKIYLIALAVAVVTMGVLLYLPYSWLGSITDPNIVAYNYNRYAGISWTFLFVSSLILLLVANLLLFKTRSVWGLWATFLYFSIFIVAQTFWLEQGFYDYSRAKNLPTGTFFLGSFVGVAFIAIAGILVFFNQYFVRRLQAKMSPPAVEPISERDLIEKDSV